MSNGLHRAFVAVPASEALRSEIAKLREGLGHLPFRWTAPGNLHLTPVFLGNISDEGLQRAQGIVQQVGERHSAFLIEFTELIYGPLNRPPRMIWLKGRLSQELQSLVGDLERELSKDPVIRHSPSRPFREVHLTLARRRRRDETSSLPNLNAPISFVLPVDRIQLITSELRPEGPSYTLVKEVTLGKK